MQAELTPWIPAVVSPLRNGVYQVRPRPGVQWWSYFRDGVWLATCGSLATPDQAMRFGMRVGPSKCHISAWRGLAADPYGVPEVPAPVRFFRIELAQTHLGTIHRVKDERGQWVADFAEKPDAERFARTDGVRVPVSPSAGEPSQ